MTLDNIGHRLMVFATLSAIILYAGLQNSFFTFTKKKKQIKTIKSKSGKQTGKRTKVEQLPKFSAPASAVANEAKSLGHILEGCEIPLKFSANVIL